MGCCREGCQTSYSVISHGVSQGCSVYEMLPAVAQNPARRVSHVSNNSGEEVNSRQGYKSLNAPFS